MSPVVVDLGTSLFPFVLIDFSFRRFAALHVPFCCFLVVSDAPPPPSRGVTDRGFPALPEPPSRRQGFLFQPLDHDLSG